MNYRDRAKLYQRVFGTDDGQRVMADLMLEFDRDIMYKPGESHADTAIRAGRRETLVYIKQLLREQDD